MGFWETYKLVWKSILVVAVLIGAVLGVVYGVMWVFTWVVSLPAPWVDVVRLGVILLVASLVISFIIWIGEM